MVIFKKLKVSFFKLQCFQFIIKFASLHLTEEGGIKLNAMTSCVYNFFGPTLSSIFAWCMVK